jgi:putative ABC transport system substrate-binding protein
MKRRELISLLGGAAAASSLSWPLAARAQQPQRMRRIGVLMVTLEDSPESRARVAALQQGLEKLGWTVGRNLQIDYRWGISDEARATAATAELLRLAPDLLLANATAAGRAVQQATRTVPTVFAGISEPVALGLVASLARPGGNITGFTNLEPSVGGKLLEVLKEIDPRVTRVAFLSANPVTEIFYPSVELAAATLSMQTFIASVHEAADIEAVVTRLAREPGGGLIIPPDTFLAFHLKLVVELAARYRLPAIYPFRYFAAAGGLVSYGPDLVDQFRRAAAYVDRILRGEKPAELPVQQPTKFEFVLNIKTAKALGLTVPDKLLALADEVIE